MANPFLTSGHEEIETAILLEKATQCDLSKLNSDYANAVAFTDGKRVFINSDDRLAEILPDYNQGMLKWLLWHEEYHKQLVHHNRFFRYLEELKDLDCIDKFQVTKEEVNIIMDILVHDSLSKMFPELVETATNNLAQMRNRNSLDYTFKTSNLEDMLDEYRKHKRGEDDEEGEGTPSKGEGIGDKKSDTPSDEEESSEKPKRSEHKSTGKKGHAKGGSGESCSGKDDDAEPEMTDKTPDSEPASTPEPEHSKTDWSKLEKIDTREFIDESEGDHIEEKIQEIKRKKLKLARLTETLNGLATTTRVRSYAVPSYISMGDGTILKGRRPGKASLYLVFDASGSMGGELQLFKEIISKSIPHAMSVPCEWFAGHNSAVEPYKTDRGDGYFKATFNEMMGTWANSGYDDDGDRTIALCLKAEEKGFSPIGVTDGGGGIYDKETLKKLKRTVLVGQNRKWLEKARQINPHIQIIDV